MEEREEADAAGAAERQRQAAAAQAGAARQQALADDPIRDAAQRARALAVARAHVFTPDPYSGRMAVEGIDVPLADEPAKLRQQREDAVSSKKYAERDAVRMRDETQQEHGKQAAVLWAQRIADIEAHARERGIELVKGQGPPVAKPRGRGGGGIGD